MATKKKGTWGGKRKGAGRPLGSGSGPSPNSRMHRVAIMLDDTELKALKRRARKSKQPISTAAWVIVARALKHAS